MPTPTMTWVWIGVGVAVLLLVAGGLWLWGRRRWGWLRPVAVPPPREPRAIQPVVLVHGLLGFDRMRVGFVRYAYFRGVPETLAGCGVEVYCPRLPPLSSVAERGRRLAEFVRELPHERVNLVAHSMGGLDARYAVTRLDLADRVCSITTIGTPHQGTPLADVGTRVLLDKLGLARMLRFFGVEVAAFYELTAARLAGFNKAMPNVPGVACCSVVASVARDVGAVSRLLVPCFLYLRKRVGANDGLVPHASQSFGDVVAEVQADHLAQIGWSRRFDAQDLYAELVRELRGRGL